MVNSEQFIGITKYLKLQTRCFIHQRSYSRVRLYWQVTLLLPTPFTPRSSPVAATGWRVPPTYFHITLNSAW